MMYTHYKDFSKNFICFIKNIKSQNYQKKTLIYFYIMFWKNNIKSTIFITIQTY